MGKLTQKKNSDESNSSRTYDTAEIRHLSIEEQTRYRKIQTLGTETYSFCHGVLPYSQVNEHLSSLMWKSPFFRKTFRKVMNQVWSYR